MTLKCLGMELSVCKLASLADAKLDAEYLLAELLKVDRLHLIADGGRELTSKQLEAYEQWLARRERREPLQYILGTQPFMGCLLQVSPAVLIPRPETELLVDRVLELLPPDGSLLDLGTGSGAIALAVAHHRPEARIVGADVSPEALRVARRNGERLRARNVEFVLSDLFSGLADRRFDVIAANLPYVPEEERELLDPEVAEHEPALALFAAEHGTSVIRRALAELKEHLVGAGHAIFELDPDQATGIAERLEDLGFAATIRRDLADRERFVEGVARS